MAKLKKSAGKTTRTTARKTGAGKQRPGLNPKSITESAQQIWLAGMGAFNRAQSEGSKLFETLVRDGLSLEQTARKFAGHRATVVRDAVEGHVGQARERAADTWDKLEKVFEERVQRALVKLGVPGREDLHALTERVERLTEALRKSGGSVPQRKTAKPVANAKPAPRKPAKATGRTGSPAVKKTGRRRHQGRQATHTGQDRQDCQDRQTAKPAAQAGTSGGRVLGRRWPAPVQASATAGPAGPYRHGRRPKIGSARVLSEPALHVPVGIVTPPASSPA